ncbi:unnamed protein product [Gemmata massiliana]|uniref:Uncharacterized protein n=1 Tax=Gemmata massiliana TaxID=1210884 RepID=A0A6P2CUL4_9BACT|nr:unnamed protein product [Gemmata massiliana]
MVNGSTTYYSPAEGTYYRAPYTPASYPYAYPGNYSNGRSSRGLFGGWRR